MGTKIPQLPFKGENRLYLPNEKSRIKKLYNLGFKVEKTYLCNMKASSIFEFTTEVQRCDYLLPDTINNIDDFSYNGVAYVNGEDSYRLQLETLYTSFKEAVLEISLQDKTILRAILQDLTMEKHLTNIPSKEAIACMEKDLVKHNSTALRNQLTAARYIVSMVGLQQYFCTEAKHFIESMLGDTPFITDNAPSQSEPQTQGQEQDNNYVFGVAGLGAFLGCGNTKAQAILNDGILEKEKIAVNIGRWRIDKKKLQAFIDNGGGEKLARIKCPH